MLLDFIGYSYSVDERTYSIPQLLFSLLLGSRLARTTVSPTQF
jgi:hypothetical protein